MDFRDSEGQSGTNPFFPTVSLSRTSDRPVSVKYATVDGTATVADEDYLPASGTLFFAPGQKTKQIVVFINGDRQAETDETVFVNLTGATDATIARAQGLLTITNDDFAPTVTQIAPAAGPIQGGDSIVITGTGFSGVSGLTGVRFGSENAASYTVNSDTQIIAVAPPFVAAAVDVTVTNPAGASVTSGASRYTYLRAPTVSAVSPDTGPNAGGSPVIITGTGFASAASTGAVRFGGANAAYVIDSDTRITTTSPALLPGTYDVSVATPGGVSATSGANRFTAVAAPTVTAVSMNTSPVAGGARVVITGTGFSTAGARDAVKFGAADAVYTIDSDTQITATSPRNAAGTYNVTVTTAGGTSATSLAGRITYVSEPAVTRLSPNAGSTLGRTDVILTGTGFTGATRVAFGGNDAWAYTVNNDTQITAMAPAAAAGAVDVRVTTSGGTSAPSAEGRYTYIAVPTVTDVSPPRGPTDGGTTVLITGTGFARAPASGAVQFGGASATYTIDSDTRIVATSPARPAGVHNVTVTTIGGTSAESRFTYLAAPTAGSFTFGTIVGYNAGDSSPTMIDVARGGDVRNGPTAYAVGSSTTARGGSVSITDSGQATYLPPVGLRDVSDSFTYTVTNEGGTSAPGTVTVTVGDPVVRIDLPSASGRVGMAYNSGGSPVTVSGGRGPYSGFSAIGLPAGLSISPSGVISGTPTTATQTRVFVTLTDSSTGAGPYTATASTELTIAAPSITLSPAPGALRDARAGVAYSQAISSMGGYGDMAYTIGGGALPPGLSLASDGVLSGTPTATGTFNFTVIATDSSGNAYTGQAAYSLTVSAPGLVINTATLPGGAVSASYRDALSASGGTAPYVFQLAAGILPAGLTLSTDGVLSGAPKQAGSFPITIRATDATVGGTFAADASYILSIDPGAQTIAFGALSNASLSDSPLSLSATASSGLTVAFTSETPAICTVSSASVTLIRTGVCTVRADQGGDADWSPASSVSQSFTVVPANLEIVAAPATGLAVGQRYRQANAASGGVGPYVYSLASGALAPGTRLDAATGEVSGVSTTAGSFSYAVRATDSQPLSAESSVTTVTVVQGEQTLVFTSAATHATVPGPDYAVSARASSGLEATFSLATGSTGCVLEGTAVRFTGAGTCVINADQPGDRNWNAAPQVEQRVEVVAAPPITGDLSAVAVPYNSNGTPINLSSLIRGGAHTAIAIGSPPAHGVVAVGGDIVTYTPFTDYFGPDSFTYTAIGAGGASSPSTVSLMVATPAAPTVSSPAVVAVPYNSAGLQIDLSSSVSGVYSSIAVGSGPAHGTASVSGDGVNYIPTPGYYGPDSFFFTATGPGGASSPATVSLTVATPPPPAVTPPTAPTTTGGGDGSVAITLGPLSSGVIAGYRIETEPLHGTAVIVTPAAQAETTGATGPQAAPEGVQLLYTPATNFMGTDTVSVVAYGPGGDSAPATFTFQAAGRAPDLSGATPSNGSITFSPTAGLVGGPFNAVRITGEPAFGTATVNGLDIVFTPGVANGGATSLTYVIDLPFGASQAGAIDLTSHLVPQSRALTATTLQGRPVTVRISDTAGGPFTGASVVSISPTTAGTATVAGSGDDWTLTFIPAGTFSNVATVTFSLTNGAGAASGTVAVTVEARPDPSLDPEVRGVATSQVASARRFADAQISNFHRRLQALHDGINESSNGVSLNVGFGGQADAHNDPREALRRQLGGRQQIRLDPGALGDDRSRDMLGLDLWADRQVGSAVPVAADPSRRGLGSAVASAEGDSSVGFWTAGSVDWGRQDAQGQRDYRFTTQGVTAGLDVRVNDSLILGAGLGYGEDKTAIGDNGSVSTGHGVTGALYGSWRLAEAFYIDGVIGGSDLDFSSRRWTDGIGGDPSGYADGDRSGGARFVSAALGRIVRDDALTSEYYARLDARSISLDGFTETGGGLSSLVWDAVEHDSVSANLGASWRWRVENRRFGTMRPSARMEWSHEFEDIGDQGVRYADWVASPTYLVPLDAWSRDSLRIELSNDWSVGDRLSLEVGYRGAFGDQSASHGAEVRGRYGW